jgi:hypothetical protein
MDLADTDFKYRMDRPSFRSTHFNKKRNLLRDNDKKLSNK